MGPGPDAREEEVEFETPHRVWENGPAWGKRTPRSGGKGGVGVLTGLAT